MRCVITGVAGFIGSHLAAAALDEGHEVVGLDCLAPYYDVEQKRENLRSLTTAGADAFRFIEVDLRVAPLADLLDGADVVYHLAGQPGVRASWGVGFESYVAHNVLATQALLEACRTARPRRLVYASSSSIYGNADRCPTAEDTAPAPVSPYGVTKLAAEHLCRVYADAWDLSTCALRYFTVYGPRQRPDMAFHQFIEHGLEGRPIRQFGDGTAIRDFTFVGDVVNATLRAGTSALEPGTVLNVAGGSSIAMRALIELVGELLGSPLIVEQHPPQPGDARATGGDIRSAERVLDWRPGTALRDGLGQQIEWHRRRRIHG